MTSSLQTLPLTSSIPAVRSQFSISDAIAHIECIIRKDGPEMIEYEALSRAFETLHNDQFIVEDGLAVRSRVIPEYEVLMQRYSSIFRTTATMQGFAYKKPHGYSGDFEIIERIYNRACSHFSHLRKWDEFFHAGHAPSAVRNRGKILSTLASELKPKSLCSIGAGPALDIAQTVEFKSIENIVLVDNDQNAIKRAQVNLSDFITARHGVEFVLKNALRYKTKQTFDLVWSSGLFDYLNDKTAIFLLRRIRDMLSDKGTVAIGNFSWVNPSRPYMELIGRWFLIHRSESDMLRIAAQAGFTESRVLADETGVNLFLIASMTRS